MATLGEKGLRPNSSHGGKQHAKTVILPFTMTCGRLSKCNVGVIRSQRQTSLAYLVRQDGSRPKSEF